MCTFCDTFGREVSELADTIRSLRGETSREDFAKRAKIATRTLIKIEMDEDPPVRLKTVRAIAKNCGLNHQDSSALVIAWVRRHLGDMADSFYIDPKTPSEIKDQESNLATRLMLAVTKLPRRYQEELLKAAQRPPVVQSIQSLNEMYERLRQ